MNEEIILFETDFWKVILHPNQAYLGYSIVVLKSESESMSDITKDEWTEFYEVVKKLESSFKKTFGATMFNWTCLLNSFYREEIIKPELHWHFRPRYKDIVKINEEVFEDLEFAHHYNKKREHIVSTELLKKISDYFKCGLIP